MHLFVICKNVLGALIFLQIFLFIERKFFGSFIWKSSQGIRMFGHHRQYILQKRKVQNLNSLPNDNSISLPWSEEKVITPRNDNSY